MPQSDGPLAESAKVLWHQGNASAFAEAAYDGTNVYYRSNVDTLTAVDGQTGTVRWAVSIGHQASAGATILGCVVAGDVVACDDLDIVAFHRSDGSFAWRYHDPSYPGMLSLYVVGPTIYAGSFYNGTVYAVDAATGVARWIQRILPGDSAADVTAWDPIADSGVVVTAFTYWTSNPRGGVAALDAATGAVRWVQFYPQATENVFARHSALWQNVVLGSSGGDDKIYAFDRTTGSTLWTLPGPGNGPADAGGIAYGGDLRAMVVVNSTLYASSSTAWFIAYDLNARAELWRVESRDPQGRDGGSADGLPIRTDGKSVFVTLASGEINAYSAGAPQVEWSLGDWRDLFSCCVAIGTDRVFAVRQDGLYAIQK